MLNFDEAFLSAKQTIYRFELKKDYHVKEDWEVFKKYRKTIAVSIHDIGKQWYEQIQTKTLEKVEVIRIRVIDKPLPEYQKYSIDWGYRVGQFYGQQTFFIRRTIYNDIVANLSFNPKDFWVIDHQYIFEVLYHSDGEYFGEKNITNKNEIANYLHLMDKIKFRCISLSDYLKHNFYENKHHLVRM